MSLTLYAVACFVAAAVVGLFAAIEIFTDKTPPWGASLLHGLFGASGLVLLILAVMHGAPNRVFYALVVLLVAALGGFFLVSFHLRGKPHPKIVAIIHPAVALLGVLTLLSLFI